MTSLQVPPNCDLTLGMVCIAKPVPGTTIWKITADERFANTAGLVQGGFIGAFADSAMGASAVTFARAGSSQKISVANAELKISFFNPVPVGAELTCQATVASGDETLVYCEATIRDTRDRVVGRATSSYVITPRT
ncbi:MAG: PaaI family thioesterase [Acidimicrobiales bacterium]